MSNWVELKKEFIKDGALRDIYAFEASESIWNEFIYAVSSCCSIELARRSLITRGKAKRIEPPTFLLSQ
ncbi:hypothetical protein [Alteromonas sp. W364]|uniref:hypothetical protein n=1 Tax=Alteromonas sp. W364 TaxID=3075610 RepID=UPI002885A351|nr:hypothetical protein [Alteromonas sp. W364]MDT0629957.1 hypothetical protein [Alteromonas sp. W364]